MLKTVIEKKYLEEKSQWDIDFPNRLIVLKPSTYKEEYREPKYLIVKAHDTFGCYVDKVGRCVGYTCLYDNEHAQTDKGQVLAVIKKEYEEEVIQKYIKAGGDN